MSVRLSGIKPFSGVSTIGCLKWGSKYSASHFNELYRQVRENVTVPYEFICFTDDPNGLECPFEEIPCDLPGWWGKLSFFKNLGYENFLFLDVDVVIVDNIDCLLTDTSDFIIIKDWMLEGYNSSVFKIRDNSMCEVWDDFVDAEGLDGEVYWGDQAWISEYPASVWPAKWMRSYAYECRTSDEPVCRNPVIPDGAKIIVFHGEPKPWDIDKFKGNYAG